MGVGEELPCGEERGGEVLEAWAVRVAQRGAGEWKRLSVAELCVEPPKSAFLGQLETRAVLLYI